MDSYTNLSLRCLHKASCHLTNLYIIHLSFYFLDNMLRVTFCHIYVSEAANYAFCYTAPPLYTPPLSTNCVCDGVWYTVVLPSVHYTFLPAREEGWDLMSTTYWQFLVFSFFFFFSKSYLLL